MNKQELVEQIVDIDFTLSQMEDYLHGEESQKITEARKGLVKLSAIVAAMELPPADEMKWVKASERLPEAYEVVACKVLYENNSPRKDWELKWGYVNRERKWETIGSPIVIEWLDESVPSISDSQKDSDIEALNKIIVSHEKIICDYSEMINEKDKEIEKLKRNE